MNISTLLSPFRSKNLLYTLSRHYAVKAANPVIAGLGKKSKDAKSASKKIVLEVEKDPRKLVSHLCGSNILQTGEDVELKPDSEYPDWLWSVHTGPSKKLHEMEPGTKEYLELLKRMNIKKALRQKAMSKIKDQ